MSRFSMGLNKAPSMCYVSHPLYLVFPVVPSLALQKCMLCPFFLKNIISRAMFFFFPMPFVSSICSFYTSFISSFFYLCVPHIILLVASLCWVWCCQNPVSTSLEREGWLVNRLTSGPMWGWFSLSDQISVLCTVTSSCFKLAGR